MDMLNRSALVVKPKQRFLDWLHAVDPTSHRITLGDVCREPHIYLIGSVTRLRTWRMFFASYARRFSKSN